MKPQLRATILALLVPFLAAADDNGCSGDQPIGSNNPGLPNPTGECVAPDDGAIDCYSVPEPGDEWMLDCDHPADRTYWHVYATGGGGRTAVTAYMLPRPDGTGIAYGICGGSDQALHDLFDSYGLCDETLDQNGVTLVNNMDVGDALAISHALHERLVFAPVEVDGTWNIAPFVLPQDLQEACPATNDQSIIDKCNAVIDTACGGTDIGITFGLTEAEAGTLAGALNQLYGVGN